MKDRRRTDVAVGRVVNFVRREKGFAPPFDAVTSVSVVPFLADGRIVAAMLYRGIDLPGGHVQDGEQTVEEVAQREAYEEVRVSLRNVRVATVIESDYYGSAPGDRTYMVMVAALVDHIHDFTPTMESSARAIVSVDEFLDRYTAGDKEMMRAIITAAWEAMSAS